MRPQKFSFHPCLLQFYFFGLPGLGETTLFLHDHSGLVKSSFGCAREKRRTYNSRTVLWHTYSRTHAHSGAAFPGCKFNVELIDKTVKNKPKTTSIVRWRGHILPHALTRVYTLKDRVYLLKCAHRTVRRGD